MTFKSATCQITKNFILHAISEERVLGVGAQIFKWQHGDNLFWRTTK